MSSHCCLAQRAANRFTGRMNPQQQSIQLAAGAGASPAKATPPPMQCDHERTVGNMCPSLYLAVYKGRTAEVMALLLQQHADVVGCQATGIVMHGQCSILELTAERNTALHVAAEQGHHELIQELYFMFRDQGLLSRQNSALDTPLHCAARAGHARAVAVLVELARDCGEMNILQCKNEDGDTALHLAARHGHGATVEVLVSAATEPATELNNAGVSPLYLAVMSGSVQAVRSIITKCKDASSTGLSSQNALHAAVFQSSEMVRLLLDWRPALADQVDSSGSSPLHFASSDGNRTIVNAILRASSPSTVYRNDLGGLSALHVAARMGHHRVVKEILGSCPDAAELRDVNGGTFIHAAARETRSSVVSLATKNNPMLRGLLDAQDRDGNTPLHLAVAAGSAAIVEDLLRKGKVRANVPNNDGHTAFDLAAGSTTSFFKMVSLVVALVAYGARLRPQRQDQLEQWVGHDTVRKGIQNTSDSLAVVAGLIIAAAFAAGFNLPGGYGGDGKAALSDDTVFKGFLLCNTGAVVTSIVAVVLLVYGKASHSASSWKSFAWALQLLWMSLVFMMMAFQAALFSVATTGALNFVFVAVYTCVIVLQGCIGEWLVRATRLSTIWRFHWKGRHVNVNRQYPFAKATVLHLQLFIAMSILVSIGFQVISGLNQGPMDTSIATSASPLH